MIVGGALSSSAVKDETIRSDATITLTFPVNVSSVQGYVLFASYQGTPGVTSVTLS